MSQNVKKKIQELVDLINKWNKEYFDLEKPSVSDRVYDSHLRELTILEKKYPEFVLENSPTKRIGSSTSNKFNKVKHQIPMLSLNKAYDFEDLKKFFNDIEKSTETSKLKFIVQPKIDGLSISLKYENGKLIQAITRGDGEIGEDVSNNVINIISDIPTTINYLKPIEVRGEVFISKENFIKVVDNEKTNYANARNLASGTLRQLDNSIVKNRNLSSFIYEIANWKENNINTQEEVIAFLKENKFNYLENYFISYLNDQNNIFEFIKDFETNQRELLNYEIDGMVIKLNEMGYYDEIGYTSKFPKYAIAYKFDEELIQTIIDDIFITIGRTGIVTYNAKLKPVLLKGTTVSAATLHNYNYVEDLKININDEVTIKKAGEIIPKVVSIFKKNSKGTFEKILICPSCKSDLIDTKTKNNQMCINKNCEEVNIKKIIHFASKGALNIEGLGENIVRKFYKLSFLRKIEDIFLLKRYKDNIIQEKGFGEKFWFNLEENINKSKNIALDKLIFALGIPQLGSKNAKSIARAIIKFENIFYLNEEKLLAINDIGEITIKEFINFINNLDNINLIKFLISQDINPIYQKTSKNLTFFKGKTFVISGKFDLSRNELTKIIEDNGGNISSTISSKTFALILGDKGGSKQQKAKDLGVKIINIDELEKILNSSNEI